LVFAKFYARTQSKEKKFDIAIDFLYNNLKMSNWYNWEKELMERLAKEDEHFAELVKGHQCLEEQLSRLSSQPYLKSEEEAEMRRLKREELKLRDQIEEILRIRKNVVLPP